MIPGTANVSGKMHDAWKPWEGGGGDTALVKNETSTQPTDRATVVRTAEDIDTEHRTAPGFRPTKTSAIVLSHQELSPHFSDRYRYSSTSNVQSTAGSFTDIKLPTGGRTAAVRTARLTKKTGPSTGLTLSHREQHLSNSAPEMDERRFGRRRLVGTDWSTWKEFIGFPQTTRIFPRKGPQRGSLNPLTSYPPPRRTRLSEVGS